MPFTLIDVTDQAGAGEQRTVRAAQEFAEAIRDLVGGDGDVVITAVEQEFDRVVEVTPRRADAVAFQVMILGEDYVVVSAHAPVLGWWTFDGAAAVAQAREVIQLIVDEGGEAVRRRGSTTLFSPAGVLRSGPHHNGGARPKRRRTRFASYRDPERDRLHAGPGQASAWFPGATASSITARQFLGEVRRLAVDWEELGLSPARSMGIATGLPFIGVEVPHHQENLRWLWIVFVEARYRLTIECSWGDDERVNDWGPSAGDVTISVPAATGTAHELATYAAAWIRDQARRQR